MVENITERTKQGNGQPNWEQIRVFTSALIGRAIFAARLGQQYGGDRDIYNALGYKIDIEYRDYAARYLRQDMAKAIINRPVKDTWRGEVNIIESDDDEETKLEKQWKELDKKLKLKSAFVRLDKLAGLGKYAILLLGFADVKKKEDWQKPITTAKELLYVKPVAEGSISISRYDEEPSSKRYGLPETYSIELRKAGNKTESVKIHHSRVLHVVDEMLEDEVIGVPRLEAVFNRLMDLEKLVGGDAEMFWRGARPGYSGSIKEGFKLNKAEKDALREQFDKYEHELTRFITAQGLDIKSLAQQIADPSGHVEVQIQMISAVTGIPKRILMGSERGELASSQDRDEWLSFIQTRREEYAEPRIIRPFVDKCIELGILAKPSDDYSVEWPDLFALSEKQRTEIGKARAEAIAKYASSAMSEQIMPPEAFLEKCLGLTEDEVEMIIEQLKQHLKELEEEEQREQQEFERQQAELAQQGGAEQIPSEQQIEQ